MFLLLLLICIAAIIAYKLLPGFAGGHQTFTDIILENVSLSGFNKSGELQLFGVILVIGGILLYLGLSFLDRKDKTIGITSIKEHRLPLYSGILVFPFLAYLLVFGRFSLPLFMGLVIFIVSQWLCRELTSTLLLTYVFCYYALLSLLTLAVQFTNAARLSSNVVYGITAVISLVLFVTIFVRFKKDAKTSMGRRILLILQCFLPGLITVWLVDQYLYQGQRITVPYAPGYVVFFTFFIVITFILAIRQAIKAWNVNEKYVIGAFTPMILFAYHSFSAAPMYAQPDQHHHGEQMIPWDQIFVHGQTLYEEYTPISGLFPFVNGFIQNVLLDGTVSDYSPAISVTIVIFCLVTMYLIYKHVGGAYATAFAVLFTLPSYNRQYMVLPVLLLLTLPGLLKKKHLWLQFWVYSCFLSGLYYPLYGAGLLLGTLPLGIHQCITYIKSDSFKQDCKKIPFIISWVILILVVTVNIPLLLNMLNHTLTYSTQTVMADGILLFGQQAPDYFLPYLASVPSLRHGLYFCLRFMLPIIGAWLFVYFLVYAIRRKEQKLTFMLLSGAIALSIPYTYTLVRADVGKILSRTAMILLAVVGMFLPIILIRYGKTLQKRSSITLVIGICCALPMTLFMQISHTKNPDMWVYPDGESQLVMDDTAKLYSYYEVPATFLKSEDTGLPIRYRQLLGDGFMVADQIPYITQYASVIEKCEAVADGKTITYMAFDGQGFYDYLGVACSATGYLPAARSFDAQQAIWDTASSNLPVIFYIQPENNYYIFRFMLDAGYRYKAEDQAFYPPELYTKVYGNEVGDDYRNYALSTDFKTHAISFGASMDSLKDIFVSQKTVGLTKQDTTAFPTQFSGTEYDCLYLELSEDFTKESAINPYVTITWTDTAGNAYACNMVSCSFKNDEEAKLLIPMGMNAGWLLSDMNDFTISVYDGSNPDTPYAETSYQKILKNDASASFIEDMALMQIDLQRGN